MPTTGRRPFIATDVVPFGAGPRRLRPPDGLSEPAKAVFIDTVTTCPSDQFQPSDIPLLARWCELTAMCEAASVELQASGMLAPDRGYSPWLRVYLDCTKALSGLALRLRLGPQSRAQKAPRRQVGPVSYYDQMQLEADDDAERS
jgi:phage terminase small subunit